MARNKYPEQTLEKILTVAQKLFLEKGYDNTTIQDIVDGLGGLTKGAVYHHFKSKEEIMDAVGEKMFFESDPFQAVSGRDDLTALEKLREMVRLNQADKARMDINVQTVPILSNPRILAGTVEGNLRVLTPRFRQLIDQGNLDGSINTPYPKELSELIPLLTSLWLAPSVYPATVQEMKNKFRFLGDMLEKMGLPLVDEEMLALADEHFDRIEALENQ